MSSSSTSGHPGASSALDRQIARMAEVAAAAGLVAPGAEQATLVELHADSTTAPPDASADFVVVASLSSNAPAAANQLLADAARVLRDGGLALLSYDAAPGAFPRLLTRALGLRVAARQIAAGDARGAKRALLAHLDLVAASAPDGLYRRAIAAEREFVARREPHALLEHELGASWSPIAVIDLAREAAAHGLSYVGELLPADRWRERTPAEVADEIARVAGPLASDQQQYVDDALGPLLHQSLFVKRSAAAQPDAPTTPATASPTQEEAYDAVLYPSRPIFECQPSRMASIAALSGVKPPEIAGATVVDLGCGIATNLLSVAARRPDVTAIGVDPSGAQIAFATALAKDAGLGNASFVRGTRAPLDDSTADFVMAHGVLSWIDDETRSAVITEAARLTRSGGLVMLSYNVSPGALYRTLTRSLGRRAAHAEIAAGDPQRAKEVVLAQLRGAAQHASHGLPHALLAAEEADRVAEVEPGTLFHDELNGEWHPLAVSDVAALAAEHGLTYVGELRPDDRWRARFADQGVRNVTKRAGASSVAQQQLVDDSIGSQFHASLFVRGSAPPEPIGGGARRPVGPPVEAWQVVGERREAEWPEITGADHIAVAAAVATAGPAGMSVGEIASSTGLSPEAVRAVASAFDAFGLVRLQLESEPLVAATAAGAHPEASPLARAELRSGQARVSSLDHRDVELDEPLLRELVLMLDGTRDRDALAAAVRVLPLDGANRFADGLDAALQALADARLLTS